MQHVCGRGGVYTGFWWGNLRGRVHLEHPRVNGRKILSWIFRKWDEGMEWIGMAERYEQVAGSCECSNEPSVSMKSGEFLDCLRHC
jgi:hypothetical protein